jgi:hypothetical protein
VAGTEVAIVARGNLDHVKEVRAVLADRGLASQIVAPPEGCGSS